ncbi:hypothetical protein B0H16DRAFT_1736841 [Mycena metata]|uniref:Uncharacterized protein n=1 Tax=Mycena metata TaxID=1033252 RepID=A0AAD7HN58_9AGAR|nr:hypothetical protein B0H16DRAFT_1736841 [Mycena metata]
MSLRRSARTRTRDPHAFWAFRDVVLYTLQYLTLAQVAQFAAVDKRSNQYAKTYVRGRITRYTSPFLPTSEGALLLGRFFQALDVTTSWIVGSVALAATCFLSDPPHPDNLNIITPRRSLGIWANFMLKEARYLLVHRAWSSGRYSEAGRMMLIFMHPGTGKRYVSITAAATPSLGALFFAAPNTDGLIAIAAHSVISPVPRFVCEQRHLFGWRTHTRSVVPVGDDPPSRWEPRFPGVTTLEFSTANWGRPCGATCPGVWHDACGLQHWGELNWGGWDGADWKSDAALALIGKGRLRYRYGVNCDNPLCPNSNMSV